MGVISDWRELGVSQKCRQILKLKLFLQNLLAYFRKSYPPIIEMPCIIAILQRLVQYFLHFLGFGFSLNPWMLDSRDQNIEGDVFVMEKGENLE